MLSQSESVGVHYSPRRSSVITKVRLNERWWRPVALEVDIGRGAQL